ncbi:MAG: phage terminase large subunit family protein, partial [Candidatus Cloacimonetes bacterium]|nr:phage terminase large subunit family protein [Candidatus Cloacimonadota bacterium]
CPHCSGHKDVPNDGYFEMKWEQMCWTKGVYTDVYLECPICKSEIYEYQKPEMLAKGKWIAENPGHRRAGFHLSSLYSPWVNWEYLALNYDNSVKVPELHQVFVNTKLGQVYEQKGESVDKEFVSKRAVLYPAEVPNRVRCLVMSVDVHKTWLEWLVQGWLRDRECYVIARGRIHGNSIDLTSDEDSFPSVWTELNKIREREWIREDGRVMQIAGVYIDSGGYQSATDTVYKYCRRWSAIKQRVVAIKGASSDRNPILTPKKWKIDKGCWFGYVGTFEAKRVIYQTLQNETPGPYYYHFPSNASAGFDETAYASLSSEKLVTEYDKRGKSKQYWVKDKDVRNEVIDLFVYNLYGILELDPNWDKLDAKYNLKTDSMRDLVNVTVGMTQYKQPKKQRSVTFNPF